MKIEGSDLSHDEMIDYSQQTAYAPGSIVEVYPLRRDSGMLNFPCFRTNARFEPGMSGGPIFNESGSVCGVICSSMPPNEDDPQWLSYGSLIRPAMATQIAFSATEHHLLYELAVNGYVATDASLATLSVSINERGERVIAARD
jgi:hypothetical protein